MHKILIAARKASGASEDDIAGLLGIPTPEYRALERQQQPLLPATARTLSSHFSIPAWYFLDGAKPLDIDTRICLLQRQLEILNKPEYRMVPPGATLALATTSIELMIAKKELGKSLARELELAEELAAMTLLYEDLQRAQGG